MNSTVLSLISLLAPIIIGVIQVPIYDELQKAIAFLQTLPKWLTQLLVVLFSFGANQLVALTGIQIPTTASGLTATAIGGVLSATLAFILKNAQNVSATKQAVIATNNAVNLTHQSILNAVSQVKTPDVIVNTGKSK